MNKPNWRLSKYFETAILGWRREQVFLQSLAAGVRNEQDLRYRHGRPR